MVKLDKERDGVKRRRGSEEEHKLLALRLQHEGKQPARVPPSTAL